MNDTMAEVAAAIWRAQAANEIGRSNARKRNKRAGMASVARHIANTLPQSERDNFMKATGLQFD